MVGWCVLAVELYAAAGLLFGVCFVALGAQRVDSQAVAAGWGFRLLILPGVAAMWPSLVSRWLSGESVFEPYHAGDSP